MTTIKLLVGFVLVIGILVLLSVLHGRRAEREKANKASQEAVIRILNTLQDTDKEVADMTDDELDNRI